MSKEYLVLFVDDPDQKSCRYCSNGMRTGLPGNACENCMNTGLEYPNGTGNIDDQPAHVFMRFTEQPNDEFLSRLARANPGRRVYCLMGASTWYSAQ